MLHWKTTPANQPRAEIELDDKAKIDLALIKGKIGSPEAYEAAGLIYDPGLAASEITAITRADGQVVLRLEHLPSKVSSLDLLVVVNNHISVKVAEYRIDIRLGPQDVSPSPAGTLQFKAGDSVNVSPQSRSTIHGDQKQADDPILLARTAILAWAQAWSRRDVDAYINAYVPDYAGNAGSRQTWIKQRRRHILARSDISVELTDLNLQLKGDSIKATFDQKYHSDGPSDHVRKRLFLVPVNGRWLISSEALLH